MLLHITSPLARLRSVCCSTRRRCPTRTKSCFARRMPTRDGDVMDSNLAMSHSFTGCCMCSPKLMIQVGATRQAERAFARGTAYVILISPTFSIHSPILKRRRRVRCAANARAKCCAAGLVACCSRSLPSTQRLLPMFSMYRFRPVAAAHHGKRLQVFAATATDLAGAIATATLASDDQAGTHVPPPVSLPLLHTLSQLLSPNANLTPACRRRSSRRQ